MKIGAEAHVWKIWSHIPVILDVIWKWHARTACVISGGRQKAVDNYLLRKIYVYLQDCDYELTGPLRNETLAPSDVCLDLGRPIHDLFSS